jgi:oligoribonuclease
MSSDPDKWRLERICWLDVETTGLDPERGLLLEVAVVVTNTWLSELARESVVIAHSAEAVEATGMCELVRDMHTQNGLLDEVTGNGSFRPSDLRLAEHRLLVLVNRVSGQGTVFLGGFSPGGVDRPYLRKYMPRLHKRLHHRSVDASGLALAMVAWGQATPPYKEHEPKHRALEDTLASIEVAKRVMRFMHRGAKLIAKEEGRPFVNVFTRPRQIEEIEYVPVVQTEDHDQEQVEAESLRSVSS